MVKQNKAVASRKQTQSQFVTWNAWMGKHPLKTILFALIAVLIVWVGITVASQHVQQAHEKAHFLQAKADLDAIYDQIVEQVGQPAAHKATQTCSYTSEEFSKGFLYCNFEHYIFFAANNKTSLAVRNQINSIVDARQEVSAKTTGTQLVNSHATGLGLYNFRLSKDYVCFTDYWYVASTLPYTISGFSNDGQAGLYLEIGCKKPALAEYFPVIQN